MGVDWERAEEDMFGIDMEWIELRGSALESGDMREKIEDMSMDFRKASLIRR
jgi:hypothetical protein